MKLTRITVNSNQMGGVPCIRGLRIPVATVVGTAQAAAEVEIDFPTTLPSFSENDIEDLDDLSRKPSSITCERAVTKAVR